MNKFLAASAALIALGMSVPAKAADMPVKAVAPIPVYSWTGCYVGVQIGYKWGYSKQTYGGTRAGVLDAFLPVGADLTGNYHVNGVIGGGEAGCQYQWGFWVWGVEVDGSWSAAGGQANPTAVAIAAGANPLRVFSTNERWLTTARGRLGYAWDKWLWYVTGGVAWTGLDVNNDAIAVAANANRVPDRVNRSGWVVGFGTEYHVSHGWSVKSEVLYADFGTFHYDNSPAANACVQCYSADVKMSEVIWRIGMNYKFDWYTPVVAKY